jgi:hypothetical protein
MLYLCNSQSQVSWLSQIFCNNWLFLSMSWFGKSAMMYTKYVVRDITIFLASSLQIGVAVYVVLITSITKQLNLIMADMVVSRELLRLTKPSVTRSISYMAVNWALFLILFSNGTRYMVILKEWLVMAYHMEAFTSYAQPRQVTK